MSSSHIYGINNLRIENQFITAILTNRRSESVNGCLYYAFDV